MKSDTEVDISKARRKLASYVRMARSGRAVILTRHGKQQAKLVGMADPAPAARNDITEFFGMWRDKRQSGEAIVRHLRKPRYR